MSKPTEMLMNELKDANNIGEFLQKNSEELVELSLSEYLRQLLEQYQLEKSKVFRRAGMTENNYGYELFRDDNKKASRDKLIQLCFGFPLTIEEAQKVLKCGKVRPLYPRDERDAYILFALKNGYEITQVNELLYEHHHEVLE